MIARTGVIIVIAAVAILLAAPFWAAEFTITLLNYIGIYALVALGVVLLTGVGGLTSFGQAAFVGIGAYATAWLTTAAAGLALARAFLRACVVTGDRRRFPRRGHAAARRTFPAARHHRLGPVDLLPVRQSWKRSAATMASPAYRRSRSARCRSRR